MNKNNLRKNMINRLDNFFMRHEQSQPLKVIDQSLAKFMDLTGNCITKSTVPGSNPQSHFTVD